MKIILAQVWSTLQTQKKELSYLKSSLISLTVAWNGMFRTRILEVFCFLTVCFFRDDFTAGLQSMEREGRDDCMAKDPSHSGSCRVSKVSKGRCFGANIHLQTSRLIFNFALRRFCSE